MSWTHRLARRDDVRLLDPSQFPVASGPDAPHAVVVGAGFGGLAAAVRLGARGYRVTLIDRLDRPGGRAQVFKQDGFTFDAGPTVITAPFLLEELWDLAGRSLEDDVELVPVDPFYQIRFDDGDIFDYAAEKDKMIEQIDDLHPPDVDGYRRFLEHSEDIFEIGFEKLGHVPFDNLSDMMRLVPVMTWLESYRSVYGYVSKFVENEKLRQVLSFHTLLVGGNPFTTSSIYAMISFLERHWGVWYAMGGTNTIVQGLADLVDAVGGTQRYGEDVDQILVSANGQAEGVRLASGETLDADLVVSNADVGWTYRHMIDDRHRSTWTNRRVESLDYSMSLFVWYFGTDRVYDDVEHHTILMGPRYRGLLDDIFDRKHLADDFSLYLHRPTRTDPSMAPDGHDAFYVLSPVPHLDSGTDWRHEAEPYRQKVEDYLSRTILPELGEHVVTSRMLTPREFKTEYKSLKGAAFSVEPTLTQSAWFRPHNQSEDVDGLYFVGAGTHPGAGIPGVLSTARVLDTVVPSPTPAV